MKKYLAFIAVLSLSSCGKDQCKENPVPLPVPEEPTPAPQPEPVPEPTPDDPITDDPIPVPPGQPEGKPKLVRCSKPQTKIIAGATVKGCFDTATRGFYLANGTSASCPYYRVVLDRAAALGYLAVCPNTPNSGSASLSLSAWKEIKKLGYKAAKFTLSSGHSQGGSSSLVLAYKLEQMGEKVEVLAIQPAYGMGYPSWKRDFPKIKSYKLIVYGTMDTLITRASVEKWFKILVEPKQIVGIRATHFNAQRPWANLLEKFD